MAAVNLQPYKIEVGALDYPTKHDEMIDAIESAISSGMAWLGDWTTATAYTQLDLVRESGNLYICTSDHTSGTFATDLSAGRWELFQTASPGITDSATAPVMTITDAQVGLSVNLVPSTTSLTGMVQNDTATPGNNMVYGTNGSGVKGWYASGATSWILEDADGTEQNITTNDEVKFNNAGGVTINWNGGSGTDADPYDLDFSVDSTVVRTTGAQSIAGVKTFSDVSNFTAGAVVGNNLASAATLNGLDVQSAGLSLILGADAGLNTRSASTTKQGAIGASLYNVSEEPAAIAYFNNTGTVNELNIGGGSANLNNFTDIVFHATAGQATTGANEVARIDDTALLLTGINITMSGVETVDGYDISEIGAAFDATDHFHHGTFSNSPVITVASDGVTITLSIEKSGGGDLLIFFSDGLYNYDTTPADTINLIAGSDVAPTLNYVYVLQGTKALTTSTSGWPATEHAPVGTVLCQSAASAQTDGVYKVHAWTDHEAGSNNQGHLSHLNFWIRQQHATWVSGGALTPTVGVGTFDVATSSGVALQLHDHAFPAKDTSTGSNVYIVNDFTTAFNKVGNLVGVLSDSNGNSLSNKYYNLVFWYVVSEKDGDCQLMCNLPTAGYTNEANAVEDTDNTAVYTMPSEFKGTGILLARLTVRHQTSGGGTYSISQNEDLRGILPAVVAGGTVGGSITTFTDNLFAVQNVSDTTKQLQFDVSGVTTLTTRTLSVPDTDGEIINSAGGQTISSSLNISSAGDATLYIEADTDNVGEYDNPLLFLRQDNRLVEAKIGLHSQPDAEATGATQNSMLIQTFASPTVVPNIEFATGGNATNYAGGLTAGTVRFSINNSGVDIKSGGLHVAGSQKLTSAGALQNITTLGMSGDISQITSGSTAGAFYSYDTTVGGMAIGHNSSGKFTVWLASNTGVLSDLIIQANRNAGVFLYYDGAWKLETGSNGVNINGALYTGGTERLSSSGALSNISTLSMSGNATISGSISTNYIKDIGVGGLNYIDLDEDESALNGTNNIIIGAVNSAHVLLDNNANTTNTAVFSIANRTLTAGNQIFTVNQDGTVAITGTLDVSGKISTNGGIDINNNDLFVDVAGDADIGVTVRRASATGRAQMKLENESGTGLWRFGMTGGGASDFSFYNGTNNVLLLDYAAESASFSGDIKTGGSTRLTSVGVLENIFSANFQSVDTRMKIDLWDTDINGIGMGNNYTYGGLNGYATTFQVNSTADRGWWFGTSAYSNAQGAMSLTNAGEMVIAQSLRVGFGTGDTSEAQVALDVRTNPASTNTISNIARLSRMTSGATAADGIGSGILYLLENSTGGERDAGSLNFEFTNATNLLEESEFVIYARNSGDAISEKFRITGYGAARTSTYGSASAPAYSWKNQSGTGLYVGNTDELNFAVGGTEYMRLDAGVLKNFGGARLEVQNAIDGGSGHGIYMWSSTDDNWGIYMSRPGATKSLADGTAVASLDSRTQHAIRFRIGNGPDQAFIWENSSEAALMSLSADTGDLYAAGNLHAVGADLVLGYSGNSTTLSSTASTPIAINFPNIAGTLVTLEGAQTFTGAKVIDANWKVNNGKYFTFGTDSSRVKLRFYNGSANYGVGMESGMTYGGLNDWAITTSNSDSSIRGFWWGHAAHAKSEGAMALTTDGQLTVASGIRVGYGEDDTSTPAAGIQSNYEIYSIASLRTQGQIYGKNGDETSPSFSFDSNRDLGFYYASTADLSVSANIIMAIDGYSGLRFGKTSSSDTDIFGASGTLGATGTQEAAVIIGPTNGRVGILLQDNDTNDDFHILSGGGNHTADPQGSRSWDTLVFRATAAGHVHIPSGNLYIYNDLVTGGTVRLDETGALQNITTISASGVITGDSLNLAANSSQIVFDYDSGNTTTLQDSASASSKVLTLPNETGTLATESYVDSAITSEDLDLTDGTTSISIDLDSETLSLLGGVGVSSTATGNQFTFALTVDELSEKTGSLVATDRLTGTSGTANFSETISGIPLSIFNNDVGWTTNTGTVTQVDGGAGLTGSVATSGSLDVGAGDGITVNADDIAVNSTVMRNNTPQTITGTWADASSVQTVFTLNRQTSGTPANGIGGRLRYQVETAAGNTESAAYLDVIATDTTATLEDFDFVLSLMKAGAAPSEMLRLSQSTGIITATNNKDYGVSDFLTLKTNFNRDIGISFQNAITGRDWRIWSDGAADDNLIFSANSTSNIVLELDENDYSVDVVSGVLKTAGTERLSNSGALSNITTLSMSGNITVGGTVDGRDIAADGAKLDGIDVNANNYVHPSYSTTSIDTSGASILDTFTSDASGHVTGITTRTLTASDITTGTFASDLFSTSTRYDIGFITGDNTNSRDKIRVWGAAAYTIGMKNNFSYGGLGNAATEYAMTFQMSNDAYRGFWWGDTSHTDAQGAMALTTQGLLTVASGIRVGYGESDTTVPSSGLQVNGNVDVVGNLTVSGTGHDTFTDTMVSQHVDHDSVSMLTAANSGLSGGGTISISRNLALDISNLSTATPTVTDSIAFDDAGTTKRIAFATIPLSIFNNDVGWTTNVGTVTQVDGGNGLTGSVTSSGSLHVGAGTGIAVSTDDVAVDTAQVVMTTLTQTIAGSKTFTSPMTIDTGADVIALKVLKNFDSPDEPAAILIASDSDNPNDDMAFEIRGNATGSAVDISDTMASADTNFAIFASGTTVIGVPSLGTSYVAPNSALLHVDGIVDISGNTWIDGNITVGGTVDGRDIATDGTKLDGIAAGAQVGTVTDITAGDGLSGGTITSSGTIAVDSTVIRTTGDQNVGGIKTFTDAPTYAASIYPSHNTTSSRVKVSMWGVAGTYGIGMMSSMSYGGLSTEFAITTQTSSNAGRGFWWGTAAHLSSQGAMALTNDGYLTVAKGARIGYGISDTTAPSDGLDIGVGDATTNSIVDVLKLTRTTSGTPADGIGTGVLFQTENSVGSVVDLGSIGFEMVDVSSTLETSDLVFKMRNVGDGLVEKLRITSTGRLKSNATGSASTPAYTFDAASGTGMWAAGVSELNFSIGGSEGMSIDASGLDVVGNITLSGTVDGRDLQTDGTKLDGIDANANNYVHPSYSTTSINTSGVQVLDTFTSDASGHVTGISTRSLAKADIDSLNIDADTLDGKDSTQFFREIIGSVATDFDNYTATGSHYVANASSIANYPVGCYNWGTLVVIRFSSTNVIQQYWPHQTDIVWTRTLWSGTWTSWRQGLGATDYAEIRAAVEAASDSNVFTDADHTKLNGVDTNANYYVHPNHSGMVNSTGDGLTALDVSAITGQTELTTPDGSADFGLVWDADAALLKKVKLNNWNTESDYIDLYANTAQTNVTTGATVLIDTVRAHSDSGIYSLVSGEITFNIAMTAVITFTVTTDVSSGNARSTSYAWLEFNTGAGYVKEDGSDVFMYNRIINRGENTGTKTIIKTVSSGDKVKIVTARLAGSDTISTQADGSSITIYNLKGGVAGPQGPAGSGLAALVNDPDPTLGGNLDVTTGGYSIVDGLNADAELLKFSGVASAINEITVSNAASAGDPTLSATGGDLNIDLGLAAKGAGQIKANSNLLITGSNQLNFDATDTKNKIDLYENGTEFFTIGMKSAITYGGLSDWAMTFQFSNTSTRGFWWGDSADTLAQGAMALTTGGLLTVASGARIGYGTGDTTTPSAGLDVTGNTNIVGNLTVSGTGHDTFSDTMVNQHVDHDSVSMLTAANSGLAGGGTISVSRNIILDIDNLATATPIAADEIAFDDAGTTKKVAFSATPLSIFNNDSGWTNNTGTVTQVDGGNGLTGSVTTSGSLNVGAGTGIAVGTNDVAVDTAQVVMTTLTQTINGTKTFSNQVLINDTTESSSTLTGSIQTDGGVGIVKNLYVGGAFNLTGNLTAGGTGHDSFTDFVANEHIDHSTVTMTAGNGFTAGSGGTIAATRTFTIGAGSGIVVNTNDVALDYAGHASNFIDIATNLEGTAIDSGDTIIYHDATDGNIKKGFVSDLPTSSGTVTSVTAGDGMSFTEITSSGSVAVDSTVVRTSGNQTLAGVKTFSNDVTVASGARYQNNDASSRDKVRVWNTSFYTIGMQSGVSFGGINGNYAMTFQMNNTSGRGFWWGNSDHTTAQGAMSLESSGKLTVAQFIRVGYGVSDTTIPATYAIDASGPVQFADGQLKTVNSTSGNGNLALHVVNSGNSTPYGMQIQFDGASPDNNTEYFIDCVDNTPATRFRVYSDGDVQNHDGTYTTISDERLKQDIVPASSQWDDIKNIGSIFKNYRWKEEVARKGEGSKILLGVIAQELELVSPYLVKDYPNLKKDELTGAIIQETIDGIPQSTKGVNYYVMFMKAVKALSEVLYKIDDTIDPAIADAIGRIMSLESSMNDTISRLDAIESQLTAQ